MYSVLRRGIMSRYRGVGTPWRGHRIIVSRIIEIIADNIKRDAYWKIAYYLANGWMPSSNVDDEAWWDFYKLLEYLVNKMKEIDEKQSYFKNIIN